MKTLIADSLVVKSDIIFNDAERLFWLEDEFEFHPGMISDTKDLLHMKKLPILRPVDVKKVPKFRCEDKELDREREALSLNCDITNFVKSCSFAVDSDDGYIYFAYEPSVITLMHLIKPDGHSKNLANELSSLIDIRLILMNITNGLMNLHQKDFFHRNIRPENIRIVKQDNGYIGKISNMFLSKRLRQGCYKQSVTEGTFYGKVCLMNLMNIAGFK